MDKFGDDHFLVPNGKRTIRKLTSNLHKKLFGKSHVVFKKDSIHIREFQTGSYIQNICEKSRLDWKSTIFFDRKRISIIHHPSCCKIMTHWPQIIHKALLFTQYACVIPHKTPCITLIQLYYTSMSIQLLFDFLPSNDIIITNNIIPIQLLPF